MNLNLRKYSFKHCLLPMLSLFYYKFETNKKINSKSQVYCFNDLDEKVKKVILKKKTDVYIWGKGFANSTSVYTNFHPHRIKKFTNSRHVPEDIIDITFGEHFAACIDKNFRLYMWKEPKLNSEKTKEWNNHERSEVIRLAEKLKVVSSVFTKDKLFFLDSKGDVYLVNITVTQPQQEEFFATSLPEPTVTVEKDKIIQVKELKNIKMIATGKDHFIALDKEGNIYGMGDDSFGQLGQANYEEQREMQMKMYNNFIQRRERLPKLIEIPEKIKKIVCGENHTLALSEGGNVYGFGYNRFLQLSNDPIYRKGIIGLCKPQIITADKFKNLKVVDIAASRNCSFFVCKNEMNGTYHFFSAGEGLRGQLGQNLIKHMSDVDEMPDISGLINSENMKPFEPLKLKCGLNHCLLLFKNPRVLYVWGNNEFGELGSRDRVFYESPIPMLEEYMIPFNIFNFGVGQTNSAFICEKVDPLKKKQILQEDQQIYEEEMKKKRIRRKRKTSNSNDKPNENGEGDKSASETKSYLQSFEQFVKTVKKYI